MFCYKEFPRALGRPKLWWREYADIDCTNRWHFPYLNLQSFTRDFTCALAKLANVKKSKVLTTFMNKKDWNELRKIINKGKRSANPFVSVLLWFMWEGLRVFAFVRQPITKEPQNGCIAHVQFVISGLSNLFSLPYVLSGSQLLSSQLCSQVTLTHKHVQLTQTH